MKITQGTSEMKRLGTQSWRLPKDFSQRSSLLLEKDGGRQEYKLEEIIYMPKYWEMHIFPPSFSRNLHIIQVPKCFWESNGID